MHKKLMPITAQNTAPNIQLSPFTTQAIIINTKKPIPQTNIVLFNLGGMATSFFLALSELFNNLNIKFHIKSLKMQALSV